MIDALRVANDLETYQKIFREADMYAIKKHWFIWGPDAPQFHVSHKWVKGYNEIRGQLRKSITKSRPDFSGDLNLYPGGEHGAVRLLQERFLFVVALLLLLLKRFLFVVALVLFADALVGSFSGGRVGREDPQIIFQRPPVFLNPHMRLAMRVRRRVNVMISLKRHRFPKDIIIAAANHLISHRADYFAGAMKFL